MSTGPIEIHPRKDEPAEEKPEPEKPPKQETRTRRRSSSTPGEADLRSRLADPIRKLAEWVSTRDPELGTILREDSPKMAALLAKVAVSTSAPGAVTQAVRGLASMLEPLDAFGRTIALLFSRWRDRRAARRQARLEQNEQQPPFYAEPVYGDGDQPEEPTFPETPLRFRADQEPPPVD